MKTYKINFLKQATKTITIFDSNLSFRERIFQCVSKASRMCNLIYANIKCTDKLVLVNLCKCYARPLLKYCFVISSPHYVY